MNATEGSVLPGTVRAGGASEFWLTIFLPTGVTWECADGMIRTRQTATGEIVMPARKCAGGAETWLTAARNVGVMAPEYLPARVLTLAPDEEAEYERLYRQKNECERQVFELKKQARMAVQKRNLMQKELRRILSKWLPLAERKFPR